MSIANVEMAAAWDGNEGDHWTQHADRYDTAGRRHRQRFIDCGLVAAGDRVLDIGCGTGLLATELAVITAHGTVLGVDLSSRMLELARRRSQEAGLDNVTFEQADAQVHPFDPASVDVAVSAFGAMFFNDRRAAFANICRALRPGGTLGMLAWRELAANEWLLEMRQALGAGRSLPVPPVGVPGPFGLADPDGVTDVLTGAGFDHISFEEVDEPIEFGRDAAHAFSFVRTMGIVEGLTRDLDDATKAETMDRVRAMLVDHETDEGVLLATSAWLITARRR